MDDRVTAVLEDAFPGREVAETIDDPVVNDRHGTVCVEFADGERVFCKVVRDGDGSRLGTERSVLEYVDAHCDVPVPSVLACEPDAPSPYLVTAPLAGEKLADVKWEADRAGEAAAMRRLGRSLAAIHARRFDSHGTITGGGADGLDVDSATWTTVFVEHVHRIREMAQSDRFDRYLDDVIEAIEENREVLDAAPATLVHNDPHGSNCHVSEAGVGMLDWEFAHVGDPARDLYRVLEQQFGLFRPNDPDHQVTALHEGYRERAGSLPDGFAERVAIYDVVRLLSASAFFESKADSVDESREDVAAWMDAEMDRRLATIR